MADLDIRLPSARRKGVSVLGSLAVAFGAAGTILGVIPCVGFFIGVPLASVGLLLGLVGLLVSGLGRRSGIGLPLAGTAVSVLGVVIGALWLGLFGVVVAQGAKNEADQQARVAAEAAVAPPAEPAPVKEVGGLKEWTQPFVSGGKSIAVEYFAPAQGDKLPMVILVHGADGLKFGFSQANYRQIARGMARRGFLVAFVHYFERTGTDFGNPVNMALNYGAWFDTLQESFAAAQKQPRAAGGRLALAGISLGGTLVIDLGARNPQRVGAVVDIFGGVPDLIVGRIKTMPPTLILHGAKDTIVPISDSRKLEKILKEKGVPYDFHVYPDAGHGFAGADLRDALDRSAAFLNKHLGGKD